MTGNQSTQAAVSLPSAGTPPTPNNGAPKRVRIIAAALLLGAILGGGRMLWRSHYFEETDNAYVAAHVSAVSSRISGVVTKVAVADNQVVRAGDVLVELDPADHEVRIEQIKAQLMQQDAQIQQVGAQIAQLVAEAASANEQVTRAEVLLKKATAEAERYDALSNIQAKAVSKTEVDAALAARDSAAADVRSQRNQAQAAQAKISAVNASLAASNAQKKYYAAQLRDAQQQLAYNRIVAPVSGRIGKKGVEVGTRVQPGQALLAIVQGGAWVTANFKETQLRGLFAGQKANVRIDAFSDREFSGVVESFSPASGAQFSLLPPDNATGNFTKIVQRVPVKILLDSKELGAISDRLAPGMSAIVDIDLRQDNPAKASSH